MCIRDSSLHSAQSVAVQNQVVSNLGESIGLVVCDGLLSAIHNAGLQCAVQLAESNDGGVSAQTLDHAVHNGVVAVSYTHLDVYKRQGLDGEQAQIEAFYAVQKHK